MTFPGGRTDPMLGEASVVVRPDMTGFGSELRRGLGTAISALGSEIQDVGKGILKKFAIPVGVAVAANITQFQALDAKIRETLTLLGGGNDDLITSRFEEMREGISQVSREVGVLEQGISEGLYQALSAGVPRDNVFQFLETAQKAAIGGNIDLLTAVDGLTTAVNSFEAQNLTAAEAADIMFKTVARGKTTFDQLSRDMAKVAPLVASTGTSFEEFMAVIATMTLSGTQTSEAFTGVRAALTGLLRPSEEMTDIWDDYGFASGEAAIASEGLQGAMQLLAEATGGSVSQLIKLLGGAEAANAVLQVTGDNVDRFNSVLRSTENSAGAATTAFEIMQEGTGRAFGQMTAAFDRLGNAGGDLADDFVVPLVRAVTSGVSALADFTEKVGDFLRPVTEAWGAFIDALTGNRVFTTLVTTVSSIAVAYGALGAAIGTVIFGAGTLITLLGWFITSTILGKIQLLSRAFLFLGDRTIRFGQLLGKLKLAQAGAKVTILGQKFKDFGALIAKFPARFGLIGLAITGLVAGIITLSNVQKGWRESAATLTTQADKLKDSLGGVVEEVGKLTDQAGEPIVNSIVFAAENEDLIDEIRRVKKEFGEDSARNLVFNTAFRMVDTGSSPEEAIGFIEELSSTVLLGIDVDFTAGDFTPEERLEALTDRARTVFEDWNNIGRWPPAPFNQELGKTKERIDELAKTAANFIVTSQGSPESLDFLKRVGEIFKEDTDASQRFVRAFEEAFENVTTADFDFSSTERLGDIFPTLIAEIDRYLPKSDEARRELEALYEAAYGPIPVTPEIPPILNEEEIAALTELPYEIQFRARWEFDEKERDAYLGLVQGIEDAWAESADFIQAKQDEIFENFRSQLPLLSEYGGAVDTVFDDWIASQQDWQTDFKAVQDLWAKLPDDILSGDLEQRVRDLPLSEQAWLAGLKPAELEKAIGVLNESWELVETAAGEVFKEDLPEIITEAGVLFNEQYDILMRDAWEAGGNVSREFGDQFREYSAFWEDVAWTRRNNIEAILAGINSGIPPALTSPLPQSGNDFSGFGGYNPITGRAPSSPISVEGDITIYNDRDQSTAESVEQAVANGVIRAYEYGGLIE